MAQSRRSSGKRSLRKGGTEPVRGPHGRRSVDRTRRLRRRLLLRELRSSVAGLAGMSGVLLLAASVGVGGETNGAACGIRTAGGDYVGSRACGQCHVAEYRHWMDSPHAAAHWQLRSERAR
ncbi:MAG: hypothetical protein D6725_15865, partial [Planctomycetota bacterium]